MRAYKVTGVQTCALPIFALHTRRQRPLVIAHDLDHVLELRHLAEIGRASCRESVCLYGVELRAICPAAHRTGLAQTRSRTSRRPLLRSRWSGVAISIVAR